MINNNLNILIPLEDVMSDSFGKYSKYIIQDRAIPDCRDGLKPGQRRIIYAMFKDGNTHQKPYRKSAKTVGNVIGNFHPHGDSSVYAAMVRMSQNWKLRYPLIDMHGNNGSIDDDPAAAMRYTEARMSQIASMMVENLNDETIPWSYNFDDTELEPVVLTSKIPNLLINGASGIASGYATEIPPHNLTEILEAAIHIISNPDAENSAISKIIKGPDFPTGGIISNVSGIKDAFETGSGRILLRAKTTITAKEIAITEIPFGVYKSNLVREIETVIVNSSISGVSYIRDESDRTGLKIAIGLNGTIDGNTILNFLFQKTKLQTWYNYNMVSIVNKKPVLTGVKTLVETFIKHQINVLVNKYKFQQAKLLAKIHILEGLIIAAKNIDEIIKIIRASSSKAESKVNIIDRFNFSEQQAEAIVNLRLYRLSATDVEDIENQHQEQQAQLAKINKILSSQNTINQEMIKELQEIKEKFGDKRRTKISSQIEMQKIDTKDLIKAEQAWVSVSKDGYIKRSSDKSYQSSTKIAFNAQDALMAEFNTNTFANIIVFFNDGTFTSLPVHSLQLTKWKEKGPHISSLVTIPAEVGVVKTIVADEGSNFNVILGSKQGMVKKTPVANFVLKRWKIPSMAMKLKTNDELLGAYIETDNIYISFISQSGFANKYLSTVISSSSPKSAGVKGINLANQEYAADFACHHDTDNLVFITDKNQAKRFHSIKLPEATRTSKGTRINKIVKTNLQNIVWFEKVAQSDKIQITTQNDTTEYESTKIPLLDIDAGNNKFISAKDIFYGATVTTFNKPVAKKTTTKKEEQLQQPKTISPNQEKPKGQINLFDILDDI